MNRILLGALLFLGVGVLSVRYLDQKGRAPANAAAPTPALFALAPERADAYLVRAPVLKALGRTDDAVKDYRRALELVKNEAERRHLEKRLAEVAGAA